MLNSDQTSTIKSAFAERYDLDLAGIRNDAAALKTAVQSPDPANQPAAGACYTYDGHQAFVPDLETLDHADVKPDDRFSERQIEANLDEAAKLSQRAYCCGPGTANSRATATRRGSRARNSSDWTRSTCRRLKRASTSCLGRKRPMRGQGWKRRWFMRRSSGAFRKRC